jgi:hypothetical protein
MEGDDGYKTDVPGIEEIPVAYIPSKIFGQKEIIVKKEPETAESILSMGFCPPIKVFIWGFFSRALCAWDLGVNLRSKMHRQAEILLYFQGIQGYDENVPKIGNSCQQVFHFYKSFCSGASLNRNPIIPRREKRIYSEPTKMDLW